MQTKFGNFNDIGKKNPVSKRKKIKQEFILIHFKKHFKKI